MRTLIAVLSVAIVAVSCSDRERSVPTSPGEPSDGAVEMTGDIGGFTGGVDDPVHDPTLFGAPDAYYVASTGRLNCDDPGGIFLRRAVEHIGGPWEAVGALAVPEWTHEYGHCHLWAPHVVKASDAYYLYYAASSFGSNHSAIGAARTTTPGDPESWEDLGPVLTSSSDDDFNAIDPMVLHDGDRWWITFGSHWSGIFLQELQDMTQPVGERHHLADRGVPPNAVEAPTIFQRGPYYYLLTSWDQCCSGTESTYKVAMGRSEHVTGPYVDEDGVRLDEGGGTIILDTRRNHIGPGGQDVYEELGEHFMVYHYYDGDANGTIRMQIRIMGWRDDWPYFPLTSWSEIPSGTVPPTPAGP